MQEIETAPVSAIIPCFNCSETIERAVESVNRQSKRPREVFIIDDCSTDKSRAVLRDLQLRFGKPWINVISLSQNRGVSIARNAGWEAATQPYLAFLDADDAWHPRKIEVQYGWMNTHPHVVLSGHLYEERVAGHGSENSIGKTTAQRISKFRQLLSNAFYTSTVMLKRELPYRFNHGFSYAEDYLLWTQIVLDGHPAWRIQSQLSYMFKAVYGEGGLSGNLWQMEKNELRLFLQLFREKRLFLLQVLFLLPFSYVKFIRRRLIGSLR